MSIEKILRGSRRAPPRRPASTSPLAVVPPRKPAVRSPRMDHARPSPATILADVLTPDALGKALDLASDVVPRQGLDQALFTPALEFVGRPSKQLRARLVEIGWALGDGTGALPLFLPQLIELVHAGSLIVDDIQDGSDERRGRPALHRDVGVPLALNIGNWLYFLPLQLVTELGLPAATELDLYRRMVTAMSRCHVGQALDLGLRVGAMAQAEIPPAARVIAALKTGALTELAIVMGAIAAGADERRILALAGFGRRFGVTLQMLDDLGNVGAPDGDLRRYEDIRRGRVTWVWAWLAQRVEPMRFAQLQRHARAVIDGRLAPEILGDRLSRLLARHGHRDAQTSLTRAFFALERTIGAHAALDDLRAAADRLLVSYG